MDDRAVRRTDEDAATSKLSAVRRGYYPDSYIDLFCSRYQARLPLINIGTYCRVTAVTKLVQEYMHRHRAAPRVQILSLGAGSDTRPFWMLPDHPNLVYYEVDYARSVRKKARVVAARLPELVHYTVGGPEGEVDTDVYHLSAQDLRDFRPEALGLEAVPTLILSECCLCYLGPAEEAAVLEGLGALLGANMALLLYEPIGLDDEFGRVMAGNLAQRHLCLPTLEKYSTLEAQCARMRALGLAKPRAESIWEVYTDWLSEEDRRRLATLEFLDEVEEMQLLLSHYCVAWGGF